MRYNELKTCKVCKKRVRRGDLEKHQGRLICLKCQPKLI